jgi:DNA segregation ATPase FtsK/SpoIIIE, S-DNA-T family
VKNHPGKDNKTLRSRKQIATDFASKIETTLDSFGIKSRVEAVTFEKTHVLLELSIAEGVRVEEVEKLSKTLAMAVSSLTGCIEMIIPLPGKSRIGIKVPVTKVRHETNR